VLAAVGFTCCEYQPERLPAHQRTDTWLISAVVVERVLGLFQVLLALFYLFFQRLLVMLFTLFQRFSLIVRESSGGGGSRLLLDQVGASLRDWSVLYNNA